MSKTLKDYTTAELLQEIIQREKDGKNELNLVHPVYPNEPIVVSDYGNGNEGDCTLLVTLDYSYKY